MGFNLFLDPIDDAPGVTREELRCVFSVRPIEESDNSWRLKFDNPPGLCHLHLTADEADSDRIVSLGVSRPVNEPRLWEGLLSIMRTGGLLLYFPGDCPALVADASHVARVPLGYVEGLGQPICIGDWREIPERIENS